MRRGGGHGIDGADEGLLPVKPKLEDIFFKQKVLLGLVLVDLIIWTILYFSYYKFNFSHLKTEDIDRLGSDNIDIWGAQPLFDLFLLNIIRCLISLASMFKFKIYTANYWIHVAALVLVIAKSILYGWDDVFGSFLMLSAILMNSAEFFLIRGIIQDGVTHVDGYQPLPEDEKKTEEAEQKQRKMELSKWQMMTVLKPYFWPDGNMPRVRVLSTYLFLALSKACNVFTPLYIGYAAQDLVASGGIRYSNLYTNIAIYAVLGILVSVFKELQNLVYLSVKQTAYSQLAKYTFRHLHSLSLEWHLKKKMGNVLRSMDRGISSADTVVTYLFLYLGPTLIECIVTFFIFYFHFNQPWLSVIALISLSLYAIFTIQITMWRKKFRAATNKHDNDFHDKATDSLINYETVKYFANEEYEIERFGESVDKYNQYTVDTMASLSLLNSGQTFVIRLALGASLMAFVASVTDPENEVGNFVAVSAYMQNLFSPLAWLGSLYQSIIQALVDMQNLSELLAEEPDVTDAPGAKDLVLTRKERGVRLEFRQVRFKYPAQPPDRGIFDLSFTVEPGTTTAIVGTTGSGKTTLGRLIFRFYDIMSGEVLVDGQSISEVTQRSLRKAVGVVPQDTVLFNESILHNLQYGNLTATQEEIDNACKAAQIYNFIMSLPEKWNTKVGERGLKLSGGEKQRVAIARALLKNPPLVILDEATSALDSVTEHGIQEALNHLAEARTTVVIAHRLSTIRNANQIIVLKLGRICEKGTHDELLAKRGVYYEMWEMQLRDAELEIRNRESKEAKEEMDGKETESKTAATGAQSSLSPLSPLSPSSPSSQSPAKWGGGTSVGGAGVGGRGAGSK